MTARKPTGETPFRLAYRSEAIIPIEIGLISYRVENQEESRNDEAIRLQLDLMDEVRATVEQRLAHYQNLMAKHYNSESEERIASQRVPTGSLHGRGKKPTTWRR